MKRNLGFFLVFVFVLVLFYLFFAAAFFFWPFSKNVLAPLILSPSSSCSDSDGGKNIFLKGHTELITNSVDEHVDVCLSSALLEESYCQRIGNDWEIKIERVSCPQGYICDAGRCTLL